MLPVIIRLFLTSQSVISTICVLSTMYFTCYVFNKTSRHRDTLYQALAFHSEQMVLRRFEPVQRKAVRVYH